MTRVQACAAARPVPVAEGAPDRARRLARPGRAASTRTRSFVPFTNGGPYDPIMNQPGIKVFHIQDVDYHSTCLTLKICLQQVKDWSDAHPSHVPIAILLELKDDPYPFPGIEFVRRIPGPHRPWTRSTARSARCSRRRTSSPPTTSVATDATLEDAVLHKGWPTLDKSRGKVLFLMDNAGDKRTRTCRATRASRVACCSPTPTRATPDAAFVERNDAKGSGADIRSLVQQGYVVRSRADADTVEARNNDTSTRDAALASGAQWVSTDYPVPNYGVGFADDLLRRDPGWHGRPLQPGERPEDTASAHCSKSTDTSTSTPARADRNGSSDWPFDRSAGDHGQMSIIIINAITVPEGSGDELAKRFAARAGAVDDQDGFEGFELLQPTDDRNVWLVQTRWRDQEAFQAWMSSPSFGARPPLRTGARGRRSTAAGLGAQRGLDVQGRRRLRGQPGLSGTARAAAAAGRRRGNASR